MPRFSQEGNEETPALSVLDLAFQGAIFGAIAGSLFLLAMSLPRMNSFEPKAIVASVVLGTWAGAPLGAFLAVVLGLTLLRRVSRSKALAASAVAAVVGALVGLLAGAVCCDIDGGMGSLYAVGGSVVSVIAVAIYLHRS
jgi:hypothetical protein